MADNIIVSKQDASQVLRLAFDDASMSIRTSSAGSPNGQPAPSTSVVVAGVNPSGNTQPLQTDSSGALEVTFAPSATQTVVQPNGALLHVTVDSMPAPVGGATAANQVTGNNSLASIDGKTPALGQALAAASVPVVLTSAQLSTLTPLSTVAVTGPLTDTQLRATPVPVSGTVTATVTGVSTAANQATEIASLSSIDTKLSSQATAALQTTGNASLASIDTKLTSPINVKPPLDTNSSSSITVQDTGSTSTAQANGQVWVTGTPTAGSVAVFALASVDSGGIEISGTFTGTVAIESSVDGGVTYVAQSMHQSGSGISAGSFTAPAIGIMNLGAKTHLRVRATAAMTGTVTVRLNQTSNTNSVYIANSIKLSDSTTNTLATIKPASTPALSTDTSLVVAFSPNSTIPLAAGAANAANQVTGNLSLASIDTKLSNLPTLGQKTMANSQPVTIASDQTAIPVNGSLTSNPTQTTAAVPVRAVGETRFRSSFAQVQSGVDSNSFSTIITGTGQAVNQSAGNLVMTSGTTANAETILRSVNTFTDNLILKWTSILSQRIVNNNFYVELVDVIGDALAFTMNSATSITVTIPSNPFTAANVGQSMYLGAITGIAVGIPGRYAIASVSGNNVNFTVAGFTATGSGTLSLFGWNYHQAVYNGTTATTLNYDAQGKGWNSGFTAATINTSASPGHMGVMQHEDGLAGFLDQLTASSTASQLVQRASRVQNVPVYGTVLALQIRMANGSTAPATTTTWTMGMVAVENFVSQTVNITGSKAQTVNYPQPVAIGAALPAGANSIGSVVIASGTVTTVSTVTAVTAITNALPTGTNTIGAVNIPGKAVTQLPIITQYSATPVTTAAYVQLVASTSAAVTRVSIFDSSGLPMILATGAAASEVIKLYIPPGGGDFDLAIPTATRVALKALTSNTTGTGFQIINFLS